ncbi:GntR family transcriptional regulator [Streptomyces liangshanensis]|uniref:GntR family transcriptional regulator n=1 Tax=Streptomyces liangshanensis TaxID=2717324 RepID=A0A6G9GTT4_9ACTN|nr:GntR family transcriptional regulator [Streptomyces liangshanensis]QIQ01469.1 GntR family transcriptional regulator [Streptomyces liangshanensis]
MNDSPEVSGAMVPGYPEPLWIQAVQVIQGEIDRGVLLPGGRLPPERQLCQQLGISRVTLRKALNSLVETGVLNPSHGRGWYVAKTVPAARKKEWPNTLESFSETAARMGLTPHSKVLRAETSPATIDEAEQLAIAPGTPLFRLERVRLLEGVAIALDVTRLRQALVPDIERVDFQERSLYATLAAAGVEPVRADSTIEATKADERAAEHLDLASGDPVLVMRQVALGGQREPLFVSTIQYAGDRYRLRTSFARS